MANVPTTEASVASDGYGARANGFGATFGESESSGRPLARSFAILRERTKQKSVLPLAAVALTCAIVGPLAHAPDRVAMAAIGVASMVSSIAGFAFSAICGSMLFHLIPNAVQAVQIMILCSIVNQAAMTWSLRRDIDWRALGIFLSGGALGLPAGVWLLLHADHAVYTTALGAFLLCYGTWMLLRRPMTLRTQHPMLDVAVGFIGGITGGAAGFPGAAVTIWCGFKGWDKTRQRALYQPFILLMQVAALLAINLARPAAAGGFGFAVGDLLCIPASLLGTAIGMTFFRGMSDTQFARVVNMLMIVSGLSYVI
jgi:uncharacterized membrane protein YfcA